MQKLFAAALLFSLSADAADHTCSIHPQKGSTDSELAAEAAADKAATGDKH